MFVVVGVFILDGKVFKLSGVTSHVFDSDPVKCSGLAACATALLAPVIKNSCLLVRVMG